MTIVLPMMTMSVCHLAMQERDIEFVDAPVSGGVVRAAEGSLTIMSSGTPAGLSRADAVLTAMTKNAPGKLFSISGGPGAGSNVKMVNQLLAGAAERPNGSCISVVKTPELLPSTESIRPWRLGPGLHSSTLTGFHLPPDPPL